jgi:molecular chaperone GrpE
MTKQHDKNKWQDVAEEAAADEGETSGSTGAAGAGGQTSAEPEIVSEDHALAFEDLKNQAQKEEARANEYLEKALRLQADLENMRRRTERDIANAHKYALDKFADALVPIVESLERGLQASQADHDNVKVLREGMEMTLKMFVDVLKRFGITQIDPLNQPFNPAHHEAVSMQPHETAAPNTVIAVFQKGYMLNERLLRPAMVVVSQSKG